MNRNDNTDDDARRKSKKKKRRKISSPQLGRIKYDFNPSEITQHFWRL